MDQLTFVYKLSISVLLFHAIVFHSCEGKYINRSISLQKWEHTDLNSADYMVSIHIVCNTSVFHEPKLSLKYVPSKITCNSYVPNTLCMSDHHIDPHMVTFGGALNSDVQVLGHNLIHCGRPFLGNPSNWSDEKVIYLDLSFSGLTYLPSGIFRHFTSLQYLNLSGNSIIGYDPGFSFGMKNLQSLDLSYNKMTELDLNWIKHNTTIHFLKFFSNSISTIKPSEPVNQSFVIDLSLNRLTCIDEALQVFLKTNITVYLNGNPLTCECMQSLQNGTFDNCTCENPAALGFQQNKHIGYIESTLEDLISLKIQLFVVAAFLTGSLITFLFMYRNRKTLCMCVKYPHDLTEMLIQPSDMETYENHAYIVCDDQDHGILSMILLELEEKRHMKIVSDARDASPTEVQIAYIEKCLSSSRRTVFVMSANFLENKLCLYVLKMAASMEYLEQKCVIIILKVKPFTKEQEKLMDKLTFHKICYEYPNDGENTELFWNSLASAINDPNLQFQILGIQHRDNGAI